MVYRIDRRRRKCEKEETPKPRHKHSNIWHHAPTHTYRLSCFGVQEERNSLLVTGLKINKAG
jgi:hypothetical protein